MTAPSLDSFKVLTFDVVGTLIDFEKGILDHLRAVSGRSVDIPAPSARAVRGSRPPDIVWMISARKPCPRCASPPCWYRYVSCPR